MPTSIAAYQFTAIEDPHALAAQLRSWAQAQRLLGTVLVAGEGFNPFLAGDSRAVECLVEALRGDVLAGATVVSPALRPWCDGRNGTGRAAA